MITKLIKEILFGTRRQPVDIISTGFHSLYPENPPSFEQWCKEFNVSMLHDRKVTYIN